MGASSEGQGPQRFVTRPVEVEAVQVSRENLPVLLAWLGDTAYDVKITGGGVMFTFADDVCVRDGEWITRTTADNRYGVCADARFHTLFAPTPAQDEEAIE